MAKKRLNKKVALVGSMVFTLLAIAAIVVFLYLSRDPEKFIKDGDAALKLAMAAADDQTRTKDYDRASRNYRKAHSLAKTDAMAIEILFTLSDIYIETDKWGKVLGCWDEIIKTDPKNVKGRYGRLKYYYIVADSGALRAWQEVASQASEFIEIADDQLLSSNRHQWEAFASEQKTDIEQLGAYLYLLRGRSLLEMTKAGAVTDPDESLAKAIDDLEKVRELVPNNPQPYWYLAQVVKTKGQLLVSRGNLEEKQKSANEAVKLLAQAVEAADDNVKAHINLLRMKLENLIEQRAGKEQIQSLESDYLSLANRFSSNAEVISMLAGFYQVDPNNLDKAVDAIVKAIELAPENVNYAITAANLYYRKAFIYGQKADFDKALQIAQNTLMLPDAQDRPGPWRWANRNNSILLHMFLANYYVEQILESTETITQAQRQQYITNAEKVVHEIEQLYGSGEEPQVIKWQGMLELAKGNEKIAIKKLYSIYEQHQASGRIDVQTSYALAKIFKDTAEVGAVAEFLSSAIRGLIGHRKPQAYLDYAQVLLKLHAPKLAIFSIETFEENFGPSQRSRALHIKALIATEQFGEVEEKLSTGFAPDDPNTLKFKLQATAARVKQLKGVIVQEQMRDRNRAKQIETAPAVEDFLATIKNKLTEYNRQQAELVSKLLDIEPNSVGEHDFTTACDNYIAEGKIAQADDLVNQFIQYFPDNMLISFYKQLLSEPDPANVSVQRRREIEKQVRLNITDPVIKAISLGIFYQRNKELDKAIEEFQKVVGSYLFADASIAGVREEEKETSSQKPETVAAELGTSERLAASHLFETALEAGDLELAEQVAALAQQKDLDNCQGCFFAGRLHMIKNQFKEAMAKLDECIDQRPIFSHGFMLRSRINSNLGNEHACIEDARKAATLNPLDGTIARGLALALYNRNQKLGDNISSEQMIETRNALINAIRLNPLQWRLRGLYADYISAENPEIALGIRQRLQEDIPSIENAFLLAKMAMSMARKETGTERKKALFETASSAFEQALEYEPENKVVLDSYSAYYRLTGQRQKAEEMLLNTDDKNLLWNHYFQAGQLEKARELFEQSYQTDPNDTNVLKGLLLIAESTGDKEAAKKYFDQLLELEETIENYLFQIQTFLKLGLVKEASHKLASFREKYPDEQRALLFEAWVAMKEGQLKKALALTNQNLQDNQNSALAWQLRGEINRLMANYSQAIDDLSKSKSLLADPITQVALAKAYLRNGAEEDAITELKNIIDHPQAPPESRKMLEAIYRQFNKKAELEKFYNETLKKFPNNPQWHNQAAEFAMAAGNFSNAEQLYLKAWQIANTQKVRGERYVLTAGTAMEGYLYALLADNKFNEVLVEAGNFIDSRFASVALVSMAEAKMKLGDKQNAIIYCQKAIDKAGTNQALVYTILRRMYSLLGTEELLGLCKQRLQDNPDSLADNFTMFNLAKITGQYDDAVRYIDRCLLVMDANGANRIDFIVAKVEVLQWAYNKTSDNRYIQRIITEYESLLAKMPNNISVLNNLAYMLAEENVRLVEALSYVKRAYEAKPNEPGFLDTYAFVLYKNGRSSEAAEFIQAALQQYERDRISAPADVYEHLGMIKEELGSPIEAIAAYEQALGIASEQSAEKTRQRIEEAIRRLSR